MSNTPVNMRIVFAVINILGHVMTCGSCEDTFLKTRGPSLKNVAFLFSRPMMWIQFVGQREALQIPFWPIAKQTRMKKAVLRFKKPQLHTSKSRQQLENHRNDEYDTECMSTP